MSAMPRIILLAWATCFLMGILPGCAATLVAGVPDIILTEGLPRVANGKGLVEDGVDLATDKDCRVIEGVARKDRKFCETRDSPETAKDFKGLSGLADNQAKPDTSSSVVK